MTADIINLRQARKARRRADKETTAAENRIRFGKTRSEKDKAKAETEKATRSLEGHRLETPSRDDDGA
ncbi:uncharacterized protein DUF4169 [Breoghania corrubedonensis]|uniref:Uncharacterized protein DUF4169 n=1 Tax=Breoghania corrubedonensis TaxID=665038 RepID=A0A2T5V4T3_9HYPH|nr:DUF4169 family protein [Breoghania corrubedonensis]PTW58777.1 uncharacterized protein DUF4169 [Breoghania corrubedonensis]